MVESYKSGVNSYIQKPVEFDQFREAVNALGLFWMVINQPPMSQKVRTMSGENRGR
jgi:two-component system response regulator